MKAINKLARLDGAWRTGNSTDRHAPYAGWMALLLVVLTVLLGEGDVSPSFAQWDPTSPPKSTDYQLCVSYATAAAQRSEACDRVLRNERLTSSDLANALVSRGAIRQSASQTDLALEDYTQAIRIDPGNTSSYEMRARLYIARNNLPAAVQDFDRSIEIDQGVSNQLAFVQRADAHRRQGQLTEAQADIAEALKLNILSEQAQTVRRLIDADVKKIAERANQPTLSDSDPEVIRARISADFQKKDFDAVVAGSTSLIQAGSSDFRDYQFRGGAYVAKRQTDQALADFNKAVDLPGHTWYAHVQRAMIFADRGDLDRALADYDAAIGEHRANEASVFGRRGRIYVRKEAYDQALDDFNKEVELKPNEPYGYYNRGQAHASQTRGLIELCRKDQSSRTEKRNTFGGGGVCARPINFDDALSEFRKAIEKKSDFADAHFEIGRIMSDVKRWDDAVRAYTEAIRANPNSTNAYNNRGAGYQQLRQRELALADYNEAIRIDARNATAYANRGGLLASNGQRQQAIADYRKALDIDGRNTPALEGLRQLGVRP